MCLATPKNKMKPPNYPKQNNMSSKAIRLETEQQEKRSMFLFFRKLNHLNPIEFSVTFALFLLLTAFLLFSFFYFDYGGSGGVGSTWWSGIGGGGAQLGIVQQNIGFVNGSIYSNNNYNNSNNVNVTVSSVVKKGGDGECNYYEGKWVWDETYPLYDSKDCAFSDGGFRCLENGRPDNGYTKWRWQPNNCNLPRFDAKLMLEKLRNKRLVFVGDSIGRNQWESLLCMLSSAVPDKASIYEVNGNPITKHMGYLVFRFRDYNCTIEYYRSPFLVVQTRPPPGSPPNVRYALRVDQLDWNSGKWKDADVLVFNAGHWWTHDKTIRSGSYFQEGNKVNLNMSVEAAFKRSIETLVKWVDNQVNVNKTSVFFRSYAPVHFRGGDWKTGGACHLETMPDLEAPYLPHTWGHFNTVKDVFSECANTSGVKLLDVTYLTLQRRDGHASLYYMVDKLAPMHRQDCSHWCLPGVPDMWNELLFADLLKQQASYMASTNSSVAGV